MHKLHKLTKNIFIADGWENRDKIIRDHLSQKAEEVWEYVRDNNVLTKENLAKILGVGE